MIPTLLKQRFRQNQVLGWFTSKSLDQCRENALDWCNANKFTNKNGPVNTYDCKSFNYQEFTRVFLSNYSHFDSIFNGDQCNSYMSFKQLSVLWHCLISRILSEEDSSGEEIDIYVKLFLSACNAFSKAVKN